MKRSLLIFIALFVGSATFAQDQFFRLGPRVGVSSSNIGFSDLDDPELQYQFEKGDAKLGFHVGVFGRISIGGIYVQPEALFTSTGGRILIDSINGGEVLKNYTLNKIDFPIMFGKKFANFLRVQIGPSFSLLLSDDAKSDPTGAIDDVNENWRDAAIGYQIGVGLDIGKLILDFKYEGNLSKWGNQIRVGDRTFETDFRNNQLILSLGLDLL